MNKIVTSLVMIAAVVVLGVGATTAFFSDTETSSGNILAAGAIDLTVDNHSWYNGELSRETTWGLTDLGEAHQFWNFDDVKPGDWGEDTISLHVKDNDSWLCADVTLTSDKDNSMTEPEGEDEIPYTADDDISNNFNGGELADHVNWYWWADDGDNVYEHCVDQVVGQDGSGQPIIKCVGGESTLPAGPMGLLSVGQTATVDLADANNNIWGDLGPLPGDSVRYIGKAWCFGDSAFPSYPQDGQGANGQNGPDFRPVRCDGSLENNVTQTDSFTADVSFRAVQSRNNDGFECEAPAPVEPPLPA